MKIGLKYKLRKTPWMVNKKSFTIEQKFNELRESHLV